MHKGLPACWTLSVTEVVPTRAPVQGTDRICSSHTLGRSNRNLTCSKIAHGHTTTCRTSLQIDRDMKVLHFKHCLMDN